MRSREDAATTTGAPAAASLDGGALRLIAICSLTYFLDGLIPVLMGPLAGPIAGSLALSRPELGAVFSANLVGQCAGLLTIPLLARRLGHRAVILWTTLGFGVSQGLTAFVWDRDTLVLSRLVTGVFLGGALPSCLAAVTQVAPAARRGLATMLLFTAYGLGGACAGFLASLFVEGGDWRQAFGVTGVACLVVVAIGWRWLEDVSAGSGEDRPRESRVPRLVDIVTPPLLGPTLLLWLLFICALTIYYCLSSWLPTLLVDIGRSPQLAAWAVGSYTGGGVVAGLLVGPLIDRFGAVRVLGLFIAVAAALLFAIGQAMASVSDAVLLALLATCGFFMLGAYGGINVVLAACYPPALRAVGVGWTKSVSRLGTVLPPVAIGYALAAGIDAGNLVSLSAVPAVLMLGALLLIRVPRFR